MSTRKIWDFWADKYERLWVQKYSLGPTRRKIISILKTIIISKDNKYRILDMGCGTGQLLREASQVFEDYDIEYYGVDISEKMISVAKNRGGNIDYEVCDINDFTVVTGSFDIIICTHSFPYYKDQPAAIFKFSKLLADKGCLILSQASHNNLYDYLIMAFVKLTTGKAKYPSIKEMKEMLQLNFKAIEQETIKERFYMPSICLFTCVKTTKVLGEEYCENSFIKA